MVSAVLMAAGAAFMLVAAVGIVRMPDLLMRMHAATKAGTLGAGLVLLSVGTFYGDLGIAIRALVTIVFLLLTAPVAAHLIGRAAYRSGIRLWDRTVIDELRDGGSPVAGPDAGDDDPPARAADRERGAA